MGSKCSKLQPNSRALLIYRAVFACVLWKISRWPFQKSIAQELDSTQCRMLAYVLPCVRSVDEDIDTFCRRRARQARTVANRVGLWSIVWCQRVIAWSAHLKRAALYQHPCTKLLRLNAATWLMTMRSQWVSVTGTRNSVLAGRTGLASTSGGRKCVGQMD